MEEQPSCRRLAGLPKGHRPSDGPVCVGPVCDARAMARQFGVTVDCRDPGALGAFWCGILGYVEDPPPDGYPDWAAYDAAHGVTPDQANAGMTIVDPDGVGPRLYFQRVPEPKVAKNRWHLDIRVSEQQTWSEVEDAARRARSAGAAVIARSADPDDRFIVLADPEGNEFCLVP